MTQEARYYYDCPIKAAFMNWYHGIEYTNDFSSEYEYHNDGTNSRDFRVEGISRIYIHQESLPLLQPHELDDGKDLTGGMCSFVDGFWSREDGFQAKHPVCIIWRNGTSFIMPKRGE